MVQTETMLDASGCSSSFTSCSASPSFPHLGLRSVPNKGLHNDILNMSHRPSCHSSSNLGATLSDQSSMRWVLDKASGLSSSSSLPSDDTPTPKSTTELIEEIALIEVEVMHLERYLLSLYRTAFEHQLATIPSSVVDQGSGFPLPCKTGSPLQVVPNLSCFHKGTDMQSDGTIGRDQTSFSHGPADSDNQSYLSPQKETFKRDPKNKVSGLHSLADHLGVSLMDDVPQTPDRLSEDIVRCISSIYCKLANPSLPHIDLSDSPTSSLSSSSAFSPQDLWDHWSPCCNEETTNPCQFQGLKKKNDPYAAMIEVLRICVDDDRFNYAATMLEKFRSLVRCLEKVDPSNMKREEKLAFWTNIHNALVMHAYLAYGIHHNRIRSTSLVLKAAYNVGGHAIDAYVIQSSILGCQPRRSAPWLQTLFSPGAKLKTGSSRHTYALDYPEPLVHFALCSGVYSDPAVRVYMAKSVFQDLRLAKEEFIQASIHIHKDRKIILPKLLYYFAKDASLNLSGLLEMVHACVSETQQKAIQNCIKGRFDKYIEWSPRNSSFRYIIQRELAKGRLSI